jgi:hypothetical protein
MEKKIISVQHNGKHRKNMNSIKNFIFIGWGILFLLLLFPDYTFGVTSTPFGNVKLTGRAYNYPVGLEGNPYMSDDWMIANILLENGIVAEKQKVKINIINNDLIFYNEDLKRVFTVDKETVKSITINPGSPDSLYFIKYYGNEVGFRLKKNDFIRVLYGGTISLYVKNMADIVNANDTNSKNKIYPKKYYYIGTTKGLIETKLNERSIIHLFPEKRKEIKTLVRSNKIKRGSEWGYALLMQLLSK